MRDRPEWFRQAQTLGNPAGTDQSRTGPWRALVDDNNDPGTLGRVFVIIPEVTGDEVHPNAAWPCAVPIGGGAADGKKWGSLFLPENGDAVWVEFVGGDPEHPVWYPGWFGEDELHDLLKQHYPKRRGFVTPSGHAVIFDDSADNIGDLQIIHRAGAILWLHGNKDAELTTVDGLTARFENDNKKITVAVDANAAVVLDVPNKLASLSLDETHSVVFDGNAKTAVVKSGAMSATLDDAAGKITAAAPGKDIEFVAATVTVTGKLHVTGDATFDGNVDV